MDNSEEKFIAKPEDNYESAHQILNETPICPYCLKPCSPFNYYCSNCDSDDVINPLASYMSFVNLRFNYGIFKTLWNKIWYDKDSFLIVRIFYLYLVLSFTPIMIIFGLPMLIVGKIPHPTIRKITIVALAVALVIFSFYFLFNGFWPRLKTNS